MTQQHSTFAEIDAPAFSIDDRPDFTSLFIATFFVAAAVHLATTVVSWPSWQNWKSSTTQHRSASRAGAQAATTASGDCFTESSTSSPPWIRTRESPENNMMNSAYRRPWQPPEPQSQPLSAELDQAGLSKPFRFRAPDLAADSDASVFASPQQPHQHRKVQFLTPQAAHKPPWDPDDDVSSEDEPVSNWDPELLDRCAASSPFISSVEALQLSPEYRSHIKAVRGRQLQYEKAESHKLQVYKALRGVDPPGLQQLFSRKDIKEFDDVTPSRLMSACECLSSSCLTLALLLLPSVLPALQYYGVATALLWCCMYMFSVGRGCASPVAWLLSIYSTYGEYQMPPPWWRLLTAVLLEAALVVVTAGIGVSGTLLCRMFTQQRQGFGERVLRLVPVREVVRPMHFK